MEKSTRNDVSLNGKSLMQIDSGSPMQNGAKEELGESRTLWASHPVSTGSNSEWRPEVGWKPHADFVNGSSSAISRVVGESFSVLSRSVSLVTDSLDVAPLTPKTGLMPELNSLPLVPAKNEKCPGVENAATEIVSETSSNVGTPVDNRSNADIDVSVRPFKTESDIETRVPNGNNDASTKAVDNTSEVSRHLENRSLGKTDYLKDTDVRIDGCVVDLKSLSCDIDRSYVDSRKSQRSKTPDSLRPLARLLHDIGLELVRQLVYKDLIDIQEAKDTQLKLDDGDKNQLAKLTEAHSKIRTKSDAFRMPVRSCRCGFACSSSNVMALHYEFGQSSDQFPHVCCCCEDFKSKWPSQFVAHMETAHDAKARVTKKLAPYVCFFCAYEHKNWMKIELHMSKCANKFSLSSNLQPQPADCDIPVLYKPGQVQQRLYPMNPPPVPSLPGRYPAPAAATATVAPSSTPAPSQATPPAAPPINVTPGQSSVMEIDGQLYSLVNHNGKVLLTSLRSQIGSSSSSASSAASAAASAAVTPSTSGSGKKVPFPPPAARPPKPALEPIKPVVPVHRETCEICGTVVNSREALWTHFRDVHRVELSRTSMREQEPWMKCTLCSTRFWTYQGLARHSSSHHNRNIAPLPQAMTPSRSTRCYLCGHSQTSNPLNHFSTFHGVTLLDMYQSRMCCMCNRRLKQSRAFEEHMIVQHRDIFANSDVLHTVIQALSTAHFLKTEDGVLQRPPLMVQQLQQNVSVAGSSAGSGAKTPTGAKGVSGASMVAGARTVSGGVGTSSGMRTVSGSTSMYSGVKTTMGASASSSMRIGSSSGMVPCSRTFSHANMVSGMKMASGVAGMRNASGTRNVSYVNSVSAGKVSNPYMRSSTVISKSTTPTTMQVGASRPGSVRTPDFKRPRPKPDSADRVKSLEQSPCSANNALPKKSREDEQKDLNKLYTDLSDIGRPILRSMRHKLSGSDDNSSDPLRPGESSEQGSVVETNCGTETKADGLDGPAWKKPRLDAVNSQSGPCGADILGTSLTLSGYGQAPEFAGKVVEPAPSGKDF